MKLFCLFRGIRFWVLVLAIGGSLSGCGGGGGAELAATPTVTTTSAPVDGVKLPSQVSAVTAN